MGLKKGVQAAYDNLTISKCEIKYLFGRNSGDIFPFDADGSGAIHFISQHAQLHAQNLAGERISIKQNHFVGLLAHVC